MPDPTTIALAATGAGGWVTAIVQWFGNRRKAKADAADVLVSAALELVTSLEAKVTALELRVASQDARIRELEAENFRLRHTDL